MERLTSDDYYNVLQLVTRKVYAFLKRPSREFPVSVVIFGANEAVIIDSSINDLGDMQYSNMAVKRPTAWFPIRAIITDAKGEGLHLTITPEDVLQ